MKQLIKQRQAARIEWLAHLEACHAKNTTYFPEYKKMTSCAVSEFEIAFMKFKIALVKAIWKL